MTQAAPAPGASRAWRFILASTSPRRRQFLQILNIPFIVVAPGSYTKSGEVDESPLPNETPAQLVQRLSQIKAQAVVNHLAAHLAALNQRVDTHRNVIIAADTEVVLDNKILGKPANAAAAVRMLRRLRKKPHLVYSGLTVIAPQPPNQADAKNKSIMATRLHQSRVWMRPYSDAEIETYVATGSPLDKAGAYGIQDQPFAPVEKLEGCFASVMGLPLGELAAALAEIDISLPEINAACSRYTGVPCCQAHAQPASGENCVSNQ